MDHQQPHHDPHIQTQTFQYYAPEQDPQYNMAYGAPMAQYHVVPGNPHQTQLQPQQGIYHNIGLIPPHQYQQQVYNTSSSPPHGNLPVSGTPPPASPDIYDPLSPPISGSDTSADGIYNSSGPNSPSSSRGTSLVHRTPRYNPSPSPTSTSGRRRHSQESEEEDMTAAFAAENLAHTRKEATRRQRIEAEQRRRDELRDGYAKLKDVLPVSNQKSSKVTLLDRATQHIASLEKTNQELQARVAALEQELQRLRALNEKISLASGETPPVGMFDGRPISPPPDVPITHSLTSVRGQAPPAEESSPSASEGGY